VNEDTSCGYVDYHGSSIRYDNDDDDDDDDGVDVVSVVGQFAEGLRFESRRR